MDHQITGGQIGEGIQFLTVSGCFFNFSLGFCPGDELALCQHSQLAGGIFHAVGQASFRQQDLALAGQFIQGNAQKAGKMLTVEHFL